MGVSAARTLGHHRGQWLGQITAGRRGAGPVAAGARGAALPLPAAAGADSRGGHQPRLLRGPQSRGPRHRGPVALEQPGGGRRLAGPRFPVLRTGDGDQPLRGDQPASTRRDHSSSGACGGRVALLQVAPLLDRSADFVVQWRAAKGPVGAGARASHAPADPGRAVRRTGCGGRARIFTPCWNGSWTLPCACC